MNPFEGGHVLKSDEGHWTEENGVWRRNVLGVPAIIYLSPYTHISNSTLTFPYSPISLPPHTTISGCHITAGPSAPPETRRPALPSTFREMPVVGYRGWAYSKDFDLGRGRFPKLGSTGVPGYWTAGKNEATCKNHAHMAPDEHCACGYYVLANLDEVANHIGVHDDMIVGAVMGWGRVVQHGTEGWRAQFAKILALLDCKFSRNQIRNTRAIAKEYNLPVLERDGLEHYVREWGDPFAEPRLSEVMAPEEQSA